MTYIIDLDVLRETSLNSETVEGQMKALVKHVERIAKSSGRPTQV
jgi:hypothetical protein